MCSEPERSRPEFPTPGHERRRYSNSNANSERNTHADGNTDTHTYGNTDTHADSDSDREDVEAQREGDDENFEEVQLGNGS